MLCTVRSKKANRQKHTTKKFIVDITHLLKLLLQVQPTRTESNIMYSKQSIVRTRCKKDWQSWLAHGLQSDSFRVRFQRNRGTQRRFPPKYIENTFQAVQSTYRKFVSVRSSQGNLSLFKIAMASARPGSSVLLSQKVQIQFNVLRKCNFF